ncbi:MAG: hypothetical protein H7177_14775 [Rhizobacter sp.]|nr:hypothetical protein [Bacteriovorax sp.]
MKTIFELFSGSKKEKATPPKHEGPKISRDELREFLINNNLQGDLLKSVTELKTKYTDISNYQAVEILMDYAEKTSH